MENNAKTREPLDDDALDAVAGGSGIPDLVIKWPELHISVSSPLAPGSVDRIPVDVQQVQDRIPVDVQQVQDPIPDYEK